MAVQIMTDVWEHSKARGTRLLVLLAIADAADRQSRQAYPGLRLLAHYARITRRQTLAHIEALIAAGELERVRGGRIGQRAVYRVLVGLKEGEAGNTLQGEAGNTLQGAADITLQGEVQRTERVKPSAKEGEVATSPLPTTEPTTEPTAERIRAALPDDLARTAFDDLCRASRNATAWAAEVEALTTGLTPPGYAWPIIGRALREMSANGDPPKVALLRGYCRRAAAGEPSAAHAGDEFVAGMQRVKEEARAAHR